MNKKKAAAVFIVLLTCGLITQAFAQGQEPRFNSNADDIRKISNRVTQAQTPAPGRSFHDCSKGCPEMVVVKEGKFTMGAPAGKKGIYLLHIADTRYLSIWSRSTASQLPNLT